MRMKILPLFAFLMILTISSKAQHDVKWSNGFKVESADKKFKLKFGGRLMYDLAFIAVSDSTGSLGDYEYLSEFRRARFFSSGTIYGNVKYKVQLDFAGKVSFKDVWLELTKIPGIGNLRVGHFKEPFRLEALTSSKYITFLERANHIPFSPERNAGIMVHDSYNNNIFGWQVGVFNNADGFGNDPNIGDGANITARVSSKFDINEEANQFVHLGVGTSMRNKKGGSYKVEARPGAHLGPKLAKATVTDVDNANLFNVEAAAVFGPLSIQGEFLSAMVKTNPESGSESYNFNSYYAQASFFLTGESRPYKNSYEGFDRIKPKKNVGKSEDGEQGYGAWELALRYSAIDLEDGSIMGGNMNDITIGLNWHLNPATRIMLNYVIGTVKDSDDKMNAAQVRFQADF